MSDAESLPDAIVKTIVLHAPLERVWRAVSDAQEFGQWFGVRFDGPFTPRTRVTGRITPTVVDPEVAKMQAPYAGTPFTFTINDIEPMTRISFSWHPFAIDKDHDYASEPMTLITFALEALEAGTKLTITESGFDGIPLERRLEAFRANDGGWTHQVKLIEGWLNLDA